MDAPSTPVQDRVLREPDTAERSVYFWLLDNKQPREKLKTIADAHGLSERTARRWRKEREQYGDARRV
jgi:hypothetical protein